MSEWKTYRLGDLCSRIKSGKGIPASEVSTTGEYPVIGGNGIRGYTNTSNFNGVCAVVGRQGAYCGNVRFFSGEAYMTEHAVVIVGNELADTRYLAYLLSIMQLGHLSAQSAQPGLSVQTLSKLSINIPDISTQRRIVGILGSLDDKIELNRRINANLEAQAQALFRSWFVDFEPFRDGPFVDSELGKIPQGWEICCVEDLASYMVSGGTPKSLDSSYYNGDIRWFTTKELKDGFLFDSEKHISETALKNSAAKLLPENTVLMAIYASPTVGRLGILTAESTYNQAAVGIIAKKEIGYAFLYLLLLSERTNLNNLASGAAQQNLNVGIVKRYRVLVPTIDILNSFNEIVNPIFTTIKNNTAQIHNLSALRDTLLPKLMAGEIKIN